MTASRPCQAEEEREECAAPSTEGQSDPPVISNENLWDVPHCPLGRRVAAGAGQKAWHTDRDVESRDSEVKWRHLCCGWQPRHTPQAGRKFHLQGRKLRLGHLAACAVSTLGWWKCIATDSWLGNRLHLLGCPASPGRQSSP